MDKYAELKREITDTVTRQFGKLSVSLEVSNVNSGLYFRLRSGRKVSPWSAVYQDIHRLEVGKKVFIAVSGYFEGTLPIEQPLEVKQGVQS